MNAIQRLLLDLYVSPKYQTKATVEDFAARRIFVTPFDGAYGLAGYVIVVQGSPPRGVIVSLEEPGHPFVPAPMFYLHRDGSRRIGEAQARTVREFLASVVPSKGHEPGADGLTSRVIGDGPSDGMGEGPPNQSSHQAEKKQLRP